MLGKHGGKFFICTCDLANLRIPLNSRAVDWVRVVFVAHHGMMNIGLIIKRLMILLSYSRLTGNLNVGSP